MKWKSTEIEPPWFLMIPQLYGKLEKTGIFWLTASEIVSVHGREMVAIMKSWQRAVSVRS